MGQVAREVVSGKLVFRVKAFLFQIIRPFCQFRPILLSKRRIPLDVRQGSQQNQHIAAFFHRHLIFFRRLAPAVNLAVRLRIRAEIVRGKGPLPTSHAGVIKHRSKLRFEQRGTEEKRERSRRIDNVNSCDTPIAEIFLGEKHRSAVHISHQLVSRQGLPIGERGDPGILFAALLLQIARQFSIKAFAAAQQGIVIAAAIAQQTSRVSAVPSPPGSFLAVKVINRVKIVIGDHQVPRNSLRAHRSEVNAEGKGIVPAPSRVGIFGEIIRLRQSPATFECGTRLLMRHGRFGNTIILVGSQIQITPIDP